MCNKQISFPKNNVRNVILYLSLISIFFTGCADQEVSEYKNDVILTEYPALADAVIARDFNSLLIMTDHIKPEVSDAVWRALAQTPAENLNAFLDHVISTDTHNGWFALSMHNLNEEQLDLIVSEFAYESIQSSSICEVFYRRGSEKILELLSDFPRNLLDNPKCALAVSTIASRSEVEDDTIISLFDRAFDSDDPEFRRRLIYGFYRASASGPIFNPAMASEISRRWAGFGINRDHVVDKYMVRILGQRSLRIVYFNYDKSELDNDIQLSVELARVIGHSALTTSSEEMFEYLFNHRNKQVVVQLLESLQSYDEIPGPLLERVESEIIQRTRDHQLFIESLILLHGNSVDVSPYKTRLDFSSSQNPYLLNRALTLFSDLEEDDDYYNRLIDGIDRGGIAGTHSMRALGAYWRESDNALRIAQIRKLIDNELMRGERSVIAGMQQILMDDNLVFEDEFNSLFNAYEMFLERGERDNIQVLSQVLSGRFPDQFEPESDVEPKPFRTPNWQRLYDMGTRAYWIIETNRGTIEVKLDPISAPFTVSSIDSLTRAGAYDGVVFHRVVKNFVIQAGDFDRRDGFGGPDYRIPTEPSFKSFERGAAGVASSGPDTEGSQFFFMHEWAPHLDGGYTIFGEVKRGMDVVDRIQIGDRIKEAGISIR